MVRDLIRSAKEQLAKAGYSEVDAEILFAHLLGINRMELHNPVALENALANVGDLAEDFQQLLNRRLSHEPSPVMYCKGSCESLRFNNC